MAGIGNDLIREARKRARLTQAQLAEKAGTTQSAIARIETGESTPSFDSVLRLVRLCGMDLDIMLVERDDSDLAQAQRFAPLSPQERSDWHEHAAAQLRKLRRSGTGNTMSPEMAIARLLGVLADHGVQYVLIGGMATIIHGSPFPTEDVDITPEESGDNLAHLSDALRALDAKLRAAELDEPLPFSHNADSLTDVQVWNLTTRYGDLDISFIPNGTDGYPDLNQDATDEVIDGVAIRVASLADIIRSKQAANRPKDQRVLPTLREILAARFTRDDES